MVDAPQGDPEVERLEEAYHGLLHVAIAFASRG
jgi:hypothetical protein